MNKIAISLALVAVCVGFVAANSQQKHEHSSCNQKPCHQPKVCSCIEQCYRNHGSGHSHGHGSGHGHGNGNGNGNGHGHGHGPSHGHSHGHGHGQSHGHGHGHGYKYATSGDALYRYRHTNGKPVLIDYYGDDDFFNDQNDFSTQFHNQQDKGHGSGNKINFGSSESDFNFGDSGTPFHHATHKHHKNHPGKGSFSHGPSNQKISDTRFSAGENNSAGIAAAHAEKDTLEGFTDRQDFEKDNVFIRNKEAGNREVGAFRDTKEEADAIGAFKKSGKHVSASDFESEKNF